MKSEKITILISGVMGDIAQQVVMKLLETENVIIIGFDLVDKSEYEKSKINNKLDRYFQCDARDMSQLKELKTKINEDKIDVLLNIAGHGDSNYFDKTTKDEFVEMMNTNFYTAVHCSQIFCENLERANGKILNFSSILALHPVPTLTAYVSSKAALIGFTKSLAIELSSVGVAVNAMCLGYCDTLNNKNYFQSVNGKNFITRFIPNKKLVSKKEVATFVANYSIQRNTSITGSIFTIDGGETIW